MTSCLPARREEVVAPPPDPPSTTLAASPRGILQRCLKRSDLWALPALGTGHTASVYKMRLRADPYRSQITLYLAYSVYCERLRSI